MGLTIGNIDGSVQAGTKTFTGVKEPVEKALALIEKNGGTYPQAAVLAGYLEDGSITMEQLAALCTEDTPEKNAERINMYLGMLAEIKGTKTVPKENIKFLFDVLLKIKEGNNKQKIDAVKFILEKISVDITKSDACGSFDAANFANTIDLQILLQGSTLGASFNNNIIDLNTFILSEFKAGDSVTKDILLKAKQIFDWMGTKTPPIGVEADRGKIAVWLAFKFKDAELAVIQAAVTKAGLSKDTTLANVKGVSFEPTVETKPLAQQVSDELNAQGILTGPENDAARLKLANIIIAGRTTGEAKALVTEFLKTLDDFNVNLPEGAKLTGKPEEVRTSLIKLLLAEKQEEGDTKDLFAKLKGELRIYAVMVDGTPRVELAHMQLYVRTKAILTELNKAPKIGQDDTTRNVIAIALAKKYPDKQAAEIITELKRVITERVKAGPPPVTEEAKITESVNAQLAALQSSDLTGIMADMFPASKVDTAPEVVGDGKVHTSDVVPDITQEQVNESFAVNFLGLTPKEYADLTDKSWKEILAKLYDKMVKGGYLKAGDKITWEAFNAYISDSKSGVLLVNRMNQTAFKEFFGNFMEENDDVPGMLAMMYRVDYTTLKKANAMELLKAYLVDAQGYVSYDSTSMAHGISREIGKTQCPSGLDTSKFEQFKKFISGDSSVKNFSLADFIEVLTKLGAKKEQIEPLLTNIAQFDTDKGTISYAEFKMLLTKIASDLKLKPDDAGIIGKREADVVALYKFLTGEKTVPRADGTDDEPADKPGEDAETGGVDWTNDTTVDAELTGEKFYVGAKKFLEAIKAETDEGKKAKLVFMYYQKVISRLGMLSREKAQEIFDGFEQVINSNKGVLNRVKIEVTSGEPPKKEQVPLGDYLSEVLGKIRPEIAKLKTEAELGQDKAAQEQLTRIYGREPWKTLVSALYETDGVTLKKEITPEKYKEIIEANIGQLVDSYLSILKDPNISLEIKNALLTRITIYAIDVRKFNVIKQLANEIYKLPDDQEGLPAFKAESINKLLDRLIKYGLFPTGTSSQIIDATFTNNGMRGINYLVDGETLKTLRIILKKYEVDDDTVQSQYFEGSKIEFAQLKPLDGQEEKKVQYLLFAIKSARDKAIKIALTTRLVSYLKGLKPEVLGKILTIKSRDIKVGGETVTIPSMQDQLKGVFGSKDGDYTLDDLLRWSPSAEES